MSIFAEQERPIRRYVALKVIKIGMDTREVIARFEAERQALALMDHPCIAQVYEAGAHSDGRPYFVMEYVAGIPITQYCDRHRLSTRARLELFIQVCGAIQHAHQKGVIHRDIKPSNLLVTVQDGKAIPKVIDFGVAKATHQRLTEKTVFTQHGVLIGTPAYMSPEQAEMSGLDVDTRTDIYALGVLLYELLVGALPFDPEMLRQAGYAEIQRIIREQEPLRPSARLSSLHGAAVSIAKQRHTEPATLERELKGDLDWITLKAMEKDRTRRYPSASELAADVTRYLGNDPVTARPVSLRYRLGKFARKHRAAVLGGTLAVSTLAVAFAVSVGLYVRSETARRHAEWQAYLAAIAAADAQVVAAESGAARFAAVHEAERRLISAPYRWRSWEWNYLVTKLDESVATLWGTTDPSTVFRRPVYGGKLAVSPDDTHLFWSTTQGLHEWDLRTYSLVSAWPAHRTVFALSDDGSRLLSTEWRLPDVPPARGPWRVIVTKTGAVLSILETNMSDVRLAEFSPDGEQIIMVGGDRSVGVWATGSGEHLGLTHISEPVVGVGFVTSHRLWILVTETAIHTWSLVSGDRSHAMVVPAGVTLTKGAVSPRGEGVLTVDNLGTLRLWRLDSRQDRLVGRHERTTSLALANDGQRAASADAFGVVRLWDLQSQGPSQVLNAHDHPQVDALLFSNSDQYVIAASQGKLRVWDPKRVSATYDWSVPPKVSFARHPRAISVDGRFLVGAELQGNLRLRDLRSNQSSIVQTMPKSVTAVAVSDAGLIVIGEEDGSIGIWKGEDLTSPVPLARIEGIVTALAIDGQGTRVAVAGSGSSVQVTRGFIPGGAAPGWLRILEVSSGRELFRSDTGILRSVAFNRPGDLLVAAPALQGAVDRATCSQPITVWDLSRRRSVLSISECGWAVAFADNGNLITSSLTDHSIRVWDGRDGSLKLEAHDAVRVSALAVSADGLRFAARLPSHIGIFDLNTATEVLRIPAVGIDVPSELRFGTDGSLVDDMSFLGTRVWHSRPTFNPAVRALVRRLLHIDAPGPRTTMPGLVDEVADQIRRNPDIEPDIKRAAIAEVQRIGDRDLAAMCAESRQTVLSGDKSGAEYRRALRMAATAARFAPWSASCVGVLGMARYRAGDYSGALESLTAAASHRPQSEMVFGSVLIAELAFRAMTLYRLGRETEASAVAEEVRAGPKTFKYPGPELSAVLGELAWLQNASRP